jgi:hypothetical protein
MADTKRFGRFHQEHASNGHGITPINTILAESEQGPASSPAPLRCTEGWLRRGWVPERNLIELRPCTFLETETFSAGIFDFRSPHYQIKSEHGHHPTFGYNVYQAVPVAGGSSHNLDNGTLRQSYRHALAINHIQRQSGILQLESSAS